MPEGWCPFAIVDEGNDAGEYTDNGEPKGLLHTTEGKTYASAKGAYEDNNSWPHITATYEGNVFKCFQHNSIHVAARSLRNLPGGVETNRDRIFQLEIVGTSDVTKKVSWGNQYVENFPTEYLDGIAKIMRWAEGELLIPRLCTLTFLPYPDSYGANGVRLTGPVFDAYSGWLGHQHAPENDHGDPGLINMVYLLTHGTPTPLEIGADMQCITARPDGNGFDVAGVDKDNICWHWWVPTLEALKTASAGENLGGYLKNISACYDGGDYCLLGQGKNNGMFMKRFTNGAWTPGWDAVLPGSFLHNLDV